MLIVTLVTGGQISFCQSLDLDIGCTGTPDGNYPLNGATTMFVNCKSEAATKVACDQSIGGPCYDCAKQACSAEPCTPALPAGNTNTSG